MLEILGLIATLLTSTAFIPQVIKVYRTKRVEDLSIFGLIQLILGISLWLIYSFNLKSIPLILNNSVSFICITLLIIGYFKFKI